MKRIALFTDFSPASGGGAAIIRSLIRHISDVRVMWFYTASEEVDVANTVRIPDFWRTAPIYVRVFGLIPYWLGWRRKELLQMASPILALNADVHWVVAHGRGAALGNMLRSLRPHVPLHVSIHDDPEQGILKRSRRYRLFRTLIRPSMARLMMAATTRDVVSKQMQAYYQKTWGVHASVVHAYIPGRLKWIDSTQDRNQFTVGCIGSIYSRRQFVRFLRGVQAYSKRIGKEPSFVLIGAGAVPNKHLPAALAKRVHLKALGNMSEIDAVKRLRQCDILYASYPFENRARVFRQTSFPTKLSTYVQVERPIFAHTPSDSTLASAVRQYQLGLVCPHLSIAKITECIEQTVSFPLASAAFESFRNSVFGEHNLATITDCLCKS